MKIPLAAPNRDIETELRRFEWGESRLVEAVQPLDVDALVGAAATFVAHFEASGDLRYLNAVLKIVDRPAFSQAHADLHRQLSAWADDAIGAFRTRRGLR
jgi:hypothetical protein